MYPPLFATLFASAPVKALLGTTPLRVYPAGEATQETVVPYAVFQTITGTPENYLGSRTDMDGYTVQVDVYAATLSSARACASAIRVALESVAYITSLREPSKDPTTRNYRYSMDVDWFTDR